jgi:Na+-driven multidrug efflux pump
MTISDVIERLNTIRRPRAENAPTDLNSQLMRLAWPSLIENLLQTMLLVCDMIFVGQLGADSIAGVGLAVS